MTHDHDPPSTEQQKRLADIAERFGVKQHQVMKRALDLLEEDYRQTVDAFFAGRAFGAELETNGAPRKQRKPTAPQKPRPKRACPVCDAKLDPRGLRQHAVACALSNKLSASDYADLLSGNEFADWFLIPTGITGDSSVSIARRSYLGEVRDALLAQERDGA